jgi:hypothetical protein
MSSMERHFKMSGQTWFAEWEPFACTFCLRQRSMELCEARQEAGPAQCVCDWWIDRQREWNSSGTWAEMMESVYRLITAPTERSKCVEEEARASRVERARGKYGADYFAS